MKGNPTFASIALAVLVSGAAFAQDGEHTFTVSLTGEAALAGGATQADPDGEGTAQLTVDAGQHRVCWKLEVAQLDALSAAHIHRGAADASGPPAVTLFNFGEPVALEGCTSEFPDHGVLGEIMQHPEQFYVNVHTETYRGGAIRGQLG